MTETPLNEGAAPERKMSYEQAAAGALLGLFESTNPNYIQPTRHDLEAQVNIATQAGWLALKMWSTEYELTDGRAPSAQERKKRREAVAKDHLVTRGVGEWRFKMLREGMFRDIADEQKVLRKRIEEIAAGSLGALSYMSGLLPKKAKDLVERCLIFCLEFLLAIVHHIVGTLVTIIAVVWLVGHSGPFGGWAKEELGLKAEMPPPCTAALPHKCLQN